MQWEHILWDVGASVAILDTVVAVVLLLRTKITQILTFPTDEPSDEI